MLGSVSTATDGIWFHKAIYRGKYHIKTSTADISEFNTLVVTEFKGYCYYISFWKQLFSHLDQFTQQCIKFCDVISGTVKFERIKWGRVLLTEVDAVLEGYGDITLRRKKMHFYHILILWPRHLSTI